MNFLAPLLLPLLCSWGCVSSNLANPTRIFLKNYDDENGTPYVLFSLEYEEVALNVLPPILLSQGSPRTFVKFSCAPYS